MVGLYGVASVLEEMAAVRDGKAPSFETAGRAASLRGRWNRLGGGANAVVRQLVEACVAPRADVECDGWDEGAVFTGPLALAPRVAGSSGAEGRTHLV